MLHVVAQLLCDGSPKLQPCSYDVFAQPCNRSLYLQQLHQVSDHSSATISRHEMHVHEMHASEGETVALNRNFQNLCPLARQRGIKQLLE
jgi:hypothetical protein